MKIIYARQTFPENFNKSIYLAGPAPRAHNVPSWRSQALKTLETSRYDGIVFVSESEHGRRSSDYDQQIEWELEAMRRSDVVVFWVSAEEDAMPEFASSIEYGLTLTSGKAVLGTPAGAFKAGYLEKLAGTFRIPLIHTLEELINAALKRLGEGAARSNAECLVPLEIWQSRHFQQWYTAQISAGHSLEDVRSVEWVFRVGPNRSYPLYIALHVAIKVCGEDRIKANEAVIIRPSIVTVCAYCPGDTREDDRFILIKEYRASVINAQGFVYELPGGASFDSDEDPIAVASDELAEETAIRLPRERFLVIGRRQIAATMVANEAVLLAARLEPEEMEAIFARQGEMYGVSAQTERTYLHVFTREELMQGSLVDYATLGQLSLIPGD